ncbi:MAG TPA: M20 family metallopeptidase [Anaeromyxobacteraceae bacterium]|nr:M20 family metallopeptidase [Anaeromyxobacteraceae bacterium]
MSKELDAALAWLASRRPSMEQLLAEVVRQNSFTANRDGVNAVASVFEAELARLGLAVERVQSERFGDHLYFESSAGDAPVFLIGHTDTVFPPGAYPDADTWRVDGDIARGPGCLDMKGGLVIALFGLAALREAGLLSRVAVRGMFVGDEEVGSPESQPLLRERARGAACGLGFESGRAKDLIVTGRKGTASLVALATGVAAHAGVEPEKGRSAIWALARFVDRAQQLSAPARGVSVTVGTFSGGTTKNTVPDRARCEVDLRYLTPEDGEALFRDLERIAEDVAFEGTRIALERSSHRPPLVRTDASAALAAEYGACQREAGLGDGEASLTGGGSDAATTAAVGVPSVDGLGARGIGFHTPNEQIELSSLVPKAEALVRFLARRAR